MALTWKPGRVGAVTGVDWEDWLGNDRRIDPYLVWADITNFEGARERNGSLPGALPLMIEFRADDQLVEADRQKPMPVGETAHPLFGCITILEPYLYPFKGQTRTGAKYVTARASPSAIEMLLKSKEVVRRFQLGLPRIASAAEIQPPPPSDPPSFLREPAPRTVVGIVDDGCAFAHPRFLRGSSGAESRVFAIWDQDPVREVDGSTENGWKRYHYGAIRREKREDDGLSVGQGSDFLPYEQYGYTPVEPRLDGLGTSRQLVPEPAPLPSNSLGGSAQQNQQPEPMLLKFPASLPLQAMKLSTHGASVMDLLVGDGDSLGPHLAEAAHPGLTPPPDFASQWDVAFVQLPTRTVLDTSGGSLGVHVLDAARFVIAQAETLPYTKQALEPMMHMPLVASGARSENQPDRINKIKAMFSRADPPREAEWAKRGGKYAKNRVVINISYGTTAGPHDGTSMLEGALEELLEKRPFTSIVASAGNAHKSRTHARLDLLTGDSKQLSWRLAPDNPLESYLEIWIPALDVDGIALAPEVKREFVFRVRPPGSTAYRQVHIGGLWLLVDDDPSASKLPMASAIFCRKVAQGLRGTMFLLAAAPTRAAQHPDGNGRAPAPHGEWTVEVGFGAPGSATGGAAVQVHAWTERNDLLFGSRRAQQSTVVGEQRVPEATEFMPDTLKLLRHHGALPAFGQRDLVGPEYSMGSLANGGSVDLQAGSVRHLWTVGGYRLSDGEMAAYSSGGPSLGRAPGFAGLSATSAAAISAASEDRRRSAGLVGAPLSDWRMGPDVDAPSDVSAASRGLRVAGFRPGLTARISGTSAAAPIMSRWLANMWYASTEGNKVPDADVQTLIESSLVFDDAPDGRTDAARPTATPLLDDLYRRGRVRLRWWQR